MVSGPQCDPRRRKNLKEKLTFGRVRVVKPKKTSRGRKQAEPKQASAHTRKKTSSKKRPSVSRWHLETPSDDELLLSPVMSPGVLGGSRVDMLCGPEVGRVLENTINVRLENLYKQQWLEISANMPQVQV